MAADTEQLGYPADHVLAVFESEAKGREAAAALTAAGSAAADVKTLSGPGDAHHLDAAAGKEGFFGRLAAGAVNLGDDAARNISRYREALAAGGAVVAVAATDEQAQAVARILAAHGGRFIFHYGRFTVEPLS